MCIRESNYSSTQVLSKEREKKVESSTYCCAVTERKGSKLQCLIQVRVRTFYVIEGTKEIRATNFSVPLCFQ